MSVSVNRRRFMGTVGSTLGLSMAGCGRLPERVGSPVTAAALGDSIQVLVDKMPLMAAPACKLFTFGGDFIPVELVPGHARMARRGITLALTELVEESWLAESDVPSLVDRIMRGNAHETYDLERVLGA